jgi:hypothetical protein
MNRLLHLAALFTAFIAATAHAQITDPNNLIAPPPPPIQFRGKHLVRSTDFQWLWRYTQPAPAGNETGLLIDPHYRPMLEDNLKAPQAFFREGRLSLANVAEIYFGVTQGSVRGIDNRYVTFSGCVPHDCMRQGLLWIDTQPQHATVVFAATEWTTQGKPELDPEAAYNLWIFSSRSIDADHLPAALIACLAKWNQTSPQHIAHALLIEPDGTPHKLDPATIGVTPADSSSSNTTPGSNTTPSTTNNAGAL